MGNEKGQSWHRYSDAIGASVKLAQQNDDEGALRLLDEVIGIAIRENESQWVLTLSHRAAIVARFLGALPRVKHYYEQSLAFNPENPAALSGLADVANEEGETELARKYAAGCYKALIEGDDFLKDARLEVLLQKWPELARL